MKDDHYEYSGGFDPVYCYPESNVLKNMLGIKDASVLCEAERELIGVRLAVAKMQPIAGNFDLSHLQAIHRYLFQDLYLWAGKIRTVDIGKGFLFCRHEFIIEEFSRVAEQLKKENYLSEVSKEELPAYLAYYLSEINAIHSFREGNGRAQRLFIDYLAATRDVYLDYSKIKDIQMNEASKKAFVGDYSKMEELIKIIMDEERK